MSDPHQLGRSLDRVLGGLTASTRPMVGVLQQWDEVVGPAIAAHSQPRRLEDTTLLVEVDDPRWVTQLRYLREQIVSTINDRAGSVVVEKIDLRVARGRGSTRAENRPAPR